MKSGGSVSSKSCWFFALLLVIFPASQLHAEEGGQGAGYLETVELYTESYLLPRLASEILLARNCENKSAKSGKQVQQILPEARTAQIAAAYPGSTFNCQTGSGLLVQPPMRLYFDNFKEYRMESESGGVKETWQVNDNIITRSTGGNLISLRVDVRSPQQSAIVEARLPALEQAAREMGHPEVLKQFAAGRLVGFLNESYRQNYAQLPMTLIDFTHNLISTADYSREMVWIAQHKLKTGTARTGRKRGGKSTQVR